MKKQKILILCTGNSCRSQIAEGYLRQFAGSNADIYSAGIEAHGINPRAIETMKEDGIDITGQTSNKIDEFDNLQFDYVITVCDNAKESCPVFPAQSELLHQNFPDPAKAEGTEEEIKNVFNNIRDQIKSFTKEFINNKIYK